MLQAKDIQKRYESVQVLRGVDIEIQSGELVSIVGASGAGKSTLLHILGTLDQPDGGEVYFKGERIDQWGNKKMAAFRNKHLGFIFQFHHLLPEFSALENVCIPAWIGGEKKSVAEKRGASILEELGLSARMDHKPSQLSGGEQQRVAVARALINKPDLILADEPTGNLDSANAREMQRLFLELRDKYNQAFLIVTHNEELAALGNRTLYMKDGLMA
jgi:lipoprotein-releasing system ATP-binding protein